MEPIIALGAALFAGAAALLIIFGVFGASQPVAAERLQRLSGADVVATPQQTGPRPSMRELVSASPLLTGANRLVARRSWSDRLARDLARADLTLTPLEYIVARVLVIAALVGVSYLLGQSIFPVLAEPLVLLVVGLIGYIIPSVYVSRRQGRRLDAFNAHLADTITLIGNGLRSGSSLLQAIERVVRETQPPVSTEFGRVIREVSLGLTTEQALNNMVRRVRSADLELLSTAISIQHQVGGNLAEILDTIAFTIRERVRIKGEIRTLTAQQRMSGYVVGFLPIALIVVISMLAPQFMGAMLEKPPEFAGLPLGVVLLGIGGLLMLIGFIFIRRIVDIEV